MVGFSLDGKRIVSGSRDMTVRIWDAQMVETSVRMKMDLYKATTAAIESFLAGDHDNASLTLRQIASSDLGPQAIYTKMFEILSITAVADVEAQYRLLNVFMEFPYDSSIRPMRSVEIYPLLSNLLESNNTEHQKIARRILQCYTDPCVHVLHGHTNLITSVAFSLDCKRIVSGSSDRTFQVWDVETGKVVGEPFRESKDTPSSVALSPDGKFVVSGSHDGVVQIWNVDTREPVGEPFRGHEQHVSCVAFSSDGKHVVSGSTDGTIRVWDVVIGKPVGEPLRGHEDRVTSVAFSSDVKHIVSGSVDKTARIWDMESRVPVGEPFRGHTDVVNSVAFSLDGKAVVSTSRDETVRIWDVEKGVLVGKPFSLVRFSLNYTPHNEMWTGNVENGMVKPLRGINSAAFSPDGNHIVSGGDNIIIWDVETGERVKNLNLLRGYSGDVREVKYSSDGLRILALGSSGLVVHIWASLVMDMAERDDDLSTTS